MVNIIISLEQSSNVEGCLKQYHKEKWTDMLRDNIKYLPTMTNISKVGKHAINCESNHFPYVRAKNEKLYKS